MGRCNSIAVDLHLPNAFDALATSAAENGIGLAGQEANQQQAILAPSLKESKTDLEASQFGIAVVLLETIVADTHFASSETVPAVPRILKRHLAVEAKGMETWLAERVLPSCHSKTALGVWRANPVPNQKPPLFPKYCYSLELSLYRERFVAWQSRPNGGAVDSLPVPQPTRSLRRTGAAAVAVARGQNCCWL
jgi:hypothetical protein